MNSSRMQGERPRGTRVLVLSYFYRPEPNFITADVAGSLAADARVTVIAPHPNYPFGKFYAGTRWWRVARSVEDGVTVWRVPIVADHSNSMLWRLVSYLSFLVMAALLGPVVAGRASVVWVYQTPFTTALAALWFKWVYRSRVVYTCADLWPESFTATGVAKPGRLIRLLFAYRRFSNRLADAIICSTPGTLEQFASEGIPRDRLHYVPVWVDAAGAGAPAADAAAGGEEPRIVYAGNLGPAQALETVVHAAARLRDRGIRLRFDLYGAGSSEDELRSLARELGADNVRFHGRVSPAEAFSVSSAAFAQIVSLRSTPLFRMTIPSKLFACFAAAAPILYGLEGDAAQIAAESGGAVAFRAGDPESLADAVEDLLRRDVRERGEMRRRLRRYYEGNFAREHLLRRYREVLLPWTTSGTRRREIQVGSPVARVQEVPNTSTRV